MQSVVVGLETWKIETFVDNLVVGVADAENCGKLRNIVEEFGQVSDGHMNWHKCETLGIGGWTRDIDGGNEVDSGIIGKYVEQGEEVRYLGIWFSQLGSVLRIEWWEKWVQALEQSLVGWGGLGLSLQGRVVVLNGYWLPKVWYLGYQIDLPEWVKKRLSKAISNWLWKGRRAQIGVKEMCGDHEQGGLGLVDIEAKLLALRAWWGKWLADSKDDGLKETLWWLWRVRYRGRGVEGVGWEGVAPEGREDVRDLHYKGFWWGIVKAWRRMRVRIDEEQEHVAGSWKGLVIGSRTFGELSLNDMTVELRDWKGGLDGWPEAWQRQRLGEHWNWQAVWKAWAKMKNILPSKMWVVWWRVLRRNVMLRNRTGWWAEEGRGCQICGEGEDVGIVQSPEHLLQDCTVSVTWWSRVDSWAGWSAKDIEGQQGGFQFWMLPGRSYWRNVGVAIA